MGVNQVQPNNVRQRHVRTGNLTFDSRIVLVHKFVVHKLDRQA